ncbi:MAG: formate dehydrogenase accessory sulfurtransferase FdhD [Tahibacter sp.]
MTRAPPPDVAGSSRSGTALRRVTRWQHGVAESRVDALAEEVPIAVYCNGRPFAVMLASPSDLEDFARGFALTERLVDSLQDIVDIAISRRIDAIEIALTISERCAARLVDRPRAFEGRSGCGICGTREVDELLGLPPRSGNPVSIAAVALRAALERLPIEQPLNQITGAMHAAAWCDVGGSLCHLREDVGRHNALDKLIGALLLERTDLSRGFVLLTSRASYEMVMKSARAGIGLLVAVSAPTALAVSLADSAGITLIGFARGADCTVYTHSQRYIAP